MADFWPSARRLEELRKEAEEQKESSKVKMEEQARAAGEKHAAEKRRAVVELKAALEEAEPAGLTVGCSEFGLNFFGRQRDVTEAAMHADAGEMGMNARQCERRSAAVELMETLFVADGKARAAQELRESLDDSEAAIYRGGVYVARSVQVEKGVVEDTEGKQCDGAAERRRNELREKMSWRMGANALDSRAATMCPVVRDRMQRWGPEHAQEA